MIGPATGDQQDEENEKDLMLCVYLDWLTGHPLPSAADLSTRGIEVVTDTRRLCELAARCADPSPLEMGIDRPLVFVEIDSGKPVAVVRSDLLVAKPSFERERRQRGRCPVCGLRTHLIGDTADGRLIGACRDAFTRAQWRSTGSRQPRRKP